MAEKIYRLKHPSADFTGYFGVDFYRGMGSTCCKEIVDRLVLDGACIIVEGETNGAGAAIAAPVPDLLVPPAEDTAEPVVGNPPEKIKAKPGPKPKPKTK